MIYLSIVIPIRNEEKFIEGTLSCLVSQEYPCDRYELIVVDGMSTDKTKEKVSRFIDQHPQNNISLLNNPGKLSSRARTIGVKVAKGEIVAVIDGHVYIPNNNIFYNIEKIVKERKAICLSRPQPLNVPGLRQGLPFWIAVARGSSIGHSRKSYIYSDHEGFIDPTSSGFAYHRSIFEKVGYFDENFDAAEDVEFNYRVGKQGIKAYTSPDLKVYYYPRDTFSKLFQQQTRYGVGRWRFIRKHPESFTKETIVPVGILLGSLLLPISMGLNKSLPLLTGLHLWPMLLYFFILMGVGLREATSRGTFFPALLVALAIWVTHLGLGWGFLKASLLDKSLRLEEKQG